MSEEKESRADVFDACMYSTWKDIIKKDKEGDSRELMDRKIKLVQKITELNEKHLDYLEDVMEDVEWHMKDYESCQEFCDSYR